jgi:hypothetical protein
MRHPLLAVVGTAAALTAALVTAPAARAASRGASTASLYPPSVLVLTIAPGEDALYAQRAVALRCLPAGGDHPDPAAACAALAPVAGDVRALAPSGQCTREFAPVTVTASGVWRGKPLSYRATFSNTCLLNSTAGAAFRF